MPKVLYLMRLLLALVMLMDISPFPTSPTATSLRRFRGAILLMEASTSDDIYAAMETKLIDKTRALEKLREKEKQIELKSIPKKSGNKASMTSSPQPLRSGTVASNNGDNGLIIFFPLVIGLFFAYKQERKFLKETNTSELIIKKSTMESELAGEAEPEQSQVQEKEDEYERDTTETGAVYSQVSTKFKYEAVEIEEDQAGDAVKGPVDFKAPELLEVGKKEEEMNTTQRSAEEDNSSTPDQLTAELAPVVSQEEANIVENIIRTAPKASEPKLVRTSEAVPQSSPLPTEPISPPSNESSASKKKSYRSRVKELSVQLAATGQAGLLCYGCLNLAYYTIATLLAWRTPFKTLLVSASTASGRTTAQTYKYVAGQLAATSAIVWFGSQATKIPRLLAALLLAPKLDKVLIKTQDKLSVGRQRLFAVGCIALWLVAFAFYGGLIVSSTTALLMA
jgi:hypothetical protein